MDINVTRHITEFFDPTMEHPKSRSWDGIVMHYLVLITSVIFGARVPLMQSKQGEMDVVIDRVVRDVAAQDSVLEGRHYFSPIGSWNDESGNHGGASEDETNSVLVFPPRAIVSYLKQIVGAVSMMRRGI